MDMIYFMSGNYHVLIKCLNREDISLNNLLHTGKKELIS